MLKVIILMLCLSYMSVGLNCQYNTENICISGGCIWTSNLTCIAGNGFCLSGWAYSSALGECTECATQP